MRIALLLLCLASSLTFAATPDNSTTALRCGHLLDIQSGKLIDDAVILTAGGKIQDVGTALAIPSGAQVINLPEATCLPGLIDAHVHLTGDPTASVINRWASRCPAPPSLESRTRA